MWLASWRSRSRDRSTDDHDRIVPAASTQRLRRTKAEQPRRGGRVPHFGSASRSGPDVAQPSRGLSRDQILGVILQKGAPCLRRRLPPPEYVLRNRRLRNRQAQLQQLTMDPRRAPERVSAAHPPNQLSELYRDSGPTASALTLPRPVAPESLPAPSHHPSQAAPPAGNSASSSRAGTG